MVMIKDRIREDMKAAMRAHDAAGLSTIRLLLAAIKQREVDEQIEADDALILSVIAKMVKQRQDSVQQYLAGDRRRDGHYQLSFNGLRPKWSIYNKLTFFYRTGNIPAMTISDKQNSCSRKTAVILQNH